VFSRWLNENNLQEIIHFSTIVEHFSLKRVWTEEGGVLFVLRVRDQWNTGLRTEDKGCMLNPSQEEEIAE
jgi:hypothetical protein